MVENDRVIEQLHVSSNNSFNETIEVTGGKMSENLYH